MFGIRYKHIEVSQKKTNLQLHMNTCAHMQTLFKYLPFASNPHAPTLKQQQWTLYIRKNTEPKTDLKIQS